MVKSITTWGFLPHSLGSCYSRSSLLVLLFGRQQWLFLSPSFFSHYSWVKTMPEINLTQRAHEVLKYARQLVEAGHAKGAVATTEDGTAVWMGLNRAKAFSMMGALQRAALDLTASPANHFLYREVGDRAVYHLCKALDFGSVELMKEFNDQSETTKDDVLYFFDKAISDTKAAA